MTIRLMSQEKFSQNILDMLSSSHFSTCAQLKKQQP
jgi:hypothetical protein